MPKVKAPAQIAATFGQGELELHRALLDYASLTGAPVSVVVKDALRAVLLDDEETLTRMRKLRSFSGAVRLAALSAVS